MPTFPKAGRFPPASTPKLRRPFQSVMNTSGSCETPPSLIKLAREMKGESSNALLDNSTPTTSPRTSAGHTPHPRAMSFNLNEAQVCTDFFTSNINLQKETEERIKQLEEWGEILNERLRLKDERILSLTRELKILENYYGKLQ